jgi:hypothetical protein
LVQNHRPGTQDEKIIRNSTVFTKGDEKVNICVAKVTESSMHARETQTQKADGENCLVGLTKKKRRG